MAHIRMLHELICDWAFALASVGAAALLLIGALFALWLFAGLVFA